MPLIARAALFGLAFLGAAGFARFDPVRARRAQTESFTNALAERAAADLGRPLSLDDCVALALSNSYAVRLADLDRVLARLGRNAAFTAFLPTVAAKAGYTAYSREPNPMMEKRSWDASLDLGLPIFAPSTWFLYAAARHGFASADIAARYVRQSIVLQTTLQVFDVLVARDRVRALETQRDAARDAAGRIGALSREGFFRPWEAGQARFQAAAREAELNSARRRLGVARGELLAGLGLAPDAPLELSGETDVSNPPPGGTADRVLKALEIHPDLALADRRVVIQDHRVRQAFCEFLPSVSLFVSRSWTGNDLAAQANNWMAGLAGAWPLFNGLGNVAALRAAKVDRHRSELERESAFLNIMVQVIAADAAVRDAAEAAALKQSAYDVAAARWADYDARSREGLVDVSDALDARARMDLAQVMLVESRYQERAALAALELAMGLTALPESEPPPETETTP